MLTPTLGFRPTSNSTLAPRRIGDRVFPIVKNHVHTVVLVSDDAIVEAQKALWQMLRVVADRAAGFVGMPMQGEPRTMQHDPHYDNVVREVGDFLVARVEALIAEHHCRRSRGGGGQLVHQIAQGSAAWPRTCHRRLVSAIAIA